jgi:mannose-6-phosphate isomerase
MAALRRADPEAVGLADEASALLDALQARRHAAGGFREDSVHPFQSNAHMHLFEAALAWIEADGGRQWLDLADELAGLALTRFTDAEQGFLREFFDEAWRPASGAGGRRVEPGHQFEWAWLLHRWGAMGHPEAAQAARRLFAAGLRGLDAARGVAVDALSEDFSVLEATARLWPQTEFLKAALALGDEAQILTPARALARYLETPVRGLWRDKLSGGGLFADEPAPASSFYHLVVAIDELRKRASG